VKPPAVPKPAIYVLLAFALGWIVLMSIKLAGNATDVRRYFSYGEAVDHGHVPYRDFRVEYPPGALLAFVLPAVVASSYRAYRIAFEAMMGVCGAGVLLATSSALVRLRGRVVPSLAFVAAAIIALGPVTLGHFDLLPALLVSIGLAALLWDRPRAAAVVLGLAIATKIYAVVVVPVALAWLWRAAGARAATRWLAVTVVTVAAVFLPFVILSPGGIGWALADQANRPLQLESSAAALLLVAHQVIGLGLGVDFSHTSANLGGHSATLAAAGTTLLETAVLLTIWIAFVRGPRTERRLAVAAMASVLAFVCLGKVFSPQFVLWLIPLVPLLGDGLALAGAAAVGASVVLTRAYFPGRWRDLILFEALPTWLLAARDALLVLLLATLVLSLLRVGPRTPTARSPTGRARRLTAPR
jgi:hypothetical protein